MNNVLAAHVLLSYIESIKNPDYKAATSTAIESLLMDAIYDWHKSDTKLSVREYLKLSEKQYEHWILGKDL